MIQRGRTALAVVAVCGLLTGCGRGGGPSPAAGADHRRDVAAPVADSPGAGTVRGRVLFDGSRPTRQKLMVVKDVEVCRKIDHRDDRLVVDDRGGIRYAVVSVRGVGKVAARSATAKEYVLDQRTCAYDPHVLIVPVGVPLKIHNSDGVLHNIHTFSTLNRPFNIAQPKALKVVEKSFTIPERIGVRCDVHGWMSSWVIVVDDDFHAVTDESGRFEIENIPPGSYTALCWQEELGELSAELVVDAGSGPVLHNFTYHEPTKPAPVN